MDIQLEKKKGFQKKHIPYVAGGAFFLIFDIESGCPRCQYRECDERAI